jgi:cytochrome c
MDSMQINKAFAAVLVSGIAFFVAGRLGTVLIPDTQLAKSAIKIEAPAGAGAVVAVADLPLPVLLAKADPAEGQKAFAAAGCIACHSFNEGGKAGIGPNLYAIVGAQMASKAGYSYSAALTAKNANWTFEALNEWLIKPAAFAAGTKMSYAGLADAKKRADIIAWLRTLSSTPVALPAASAAAVMPAAAAAPAPKPIATLLASADAAAGQASFLQLGCIACHSFAQGGKNGLGPNLYGVVGAKIANHEGYTYSKALAGKDGMWTFDELNAWLIKPAAYAAGTKMTYAGVTDDQVRANVIAYLRTLAATPVPLP